MGMSNEQLREWFDQHVVGSDVYPEDFEGYIGHCFFGEVDRILSAMNGDMRPNGIPPAPVARIEALTWSRLADSDGVIEAYQIELPITAAASGITYYFGRYRQIRDLVEDRRTTGSEAAWGIVTSVTAVWEQLIADRHIAVLSDL